MHEEEHLGNYPHAVNCEGMAFPAPSRPAEHQVQLQCAGLSNCRAAPSLLAALISASIRRYNHVHCSILTTNSHISHQMRFGMFVSHVVKCAHQNGLMQSLLKIQQ